MSIFFIFLSQVSGGLIDVTGGFNVLTFGDFRSWNDQTWGTLGASGNVTIDNSYSIGTQWANSGNYPDNAVVAGGAVDLSGSGSVWGGISAGGNVNVSQTVHGDINEYRSDINTVFNFSQAKTQLEGISNQFATNPNAISGFKEYSSLNLIGDNLDINYFTVDASDFEGISQIKFDIADGSKAVITVTGENVSFVPSWGGNFGVQGLDDNKEYSSNILWNFVDAKTLTVGGSYGTILALDAEVELVGGEIWGDLITGSVTGQSQIHVSHYTGDIPSVPESSSVLMIVLGICGLFIASRKKLALKK
jgi:choice-of-anchor A domain-containing protein